jgi:hypothetical protein
MKACDSLRPKTRHKRQPVDEIATVDKTNIRDASSLLMSVPCDMRLGSLQRNSLNAALFGVDSKHQLTAPITRRRPHFILGLRMGGGHQLRCEPWIQDQCVVKRLVVPPLGTVGCGPTATAFLVSHPYAVTGSTVAPRIRSTLSTVSGPSDSAARRAITDQVRRCEPARCTRPTPLQPKRSAPNAHWRYCATRLCSGSPRCRRPMLAAMSSTRPTKVS